MSVMSLVGARPQFVKLAPLSKALRRHFRETIVHTGQHYDHAMSDKFFSDLQIPMPDISLGIGSGSHGRQTAAMISKLEQVFEKDRPELLLIFGDTNSTLAGAVAASKMHIPIVHIEAGLRSFNRYMPEEINRLVADHISDYLFAPTETAMGHLAREGIAELATNTGDIMTDALAQNIVRAKKLVDRDQEYLADGVEFVLVTLHRPSNVDDPERLSKIASQLSALDQKILFPVHPRTKKIIDDHGVAFDANIALLEPLGYLEFITLEDAAQKIVTDSGGVQKEAYMLGKPCITVRTETEWVETVENGWNVLVGSDLDNLTTRIQEFKPTGTPPDVYGSNVADRMVSEIQAILA